VCKDVSAFALCLITHRRSSDFHSESSMFVFPHKLILKTCGTTTLLLGLERILEIASRALEGLLPSSDRSSEQLGKLVKQCFYSRKSFMFPERQKGPHKDWMLEVAVLDRFFDQGSAYTVGKMNGDHWLLYMTASKSNAVEQSAGQVQRPLRLPSVPRATLSDQTLEILMTHLSPMSCARFEFPAELAAPDADQVIDCSVRDRGHLLGTRLSSQLGLDSLFPGTKLDAFAFEPCGFSANAVISGVEGLGKTLEDGYWTVHVTPEEDSSYASFETNMHMDESGGPGKKDLAWLIARVLSIFEPARLSITLFTASDSSRTEEVKDAAPKQDQGEVLHSLQMKDYKRTDRIAYEFEDYDLVFISFDKHGIRLPSR
jgi:S-adenosylmethionine decarboxylase